jgi:hypothetical protein
MLGHPFLSPMKVISSLLIADDSSIKILIPEFNPSHRTMKNKIVRK